MLFVVEMELFGKVLIFGLHGVRKKYIDVLKSVHGYAFSPE